MTSARSRSSSSEVQGLLLFSTIGVSLANFTAAPGTHDIIATKRSNPESYSLPFTQNGMDGDRHAATQYTMGQVFPSATVRCERCDALKVIVKPIDGKGPRALRCPKCNDLDPLRLPGDRRLDGRRTAAPKIKPHLPDCPRCKSRMLRGPRLFMWIFGDIRAFECSACGYILILKYPFEPTLADQAITLKPEAEEQAYPSSLPTSE